MKTAPQVAVVSLFLCSVCVAEVQLYDFPSEAPKTDDFRVTVNGQETFVYQTEVAAIVAFGTDGECRLRVERGKPFSKVVVRPLHAGITPETAGNAVEFEVSAGARLSVEFDGDITRPLYVFANPLESRPADESAANLKYFGPARASGRSDRPEERRDALPGRRGSRAGLRAGGRRREYPHRRARHPRRLVRRELKTPSVLLRKCRKRRDRDLLIADSFGWTVHLSQCDGVEIAGMKQGAGGPIRTASTSRRVATSA